MSIEITTTLQRIVTFFKFSIKKKEEELVIRQRRNFVPIVFWLIFLLFIFAVGYLDYKEMGVEAFIPNDGKKILGLIAFIVIIYMITKSNIVETLKTRALVFKYPEKEIWYDGMKMPIDRANHFGLYKDASARHYYYSIVLAYDEGDEYDIGLDDMIFLPTRFTKLFLIDVANEANTFLTNNSHVIDREMDVLEKVIIAVYSGIMLFLLYLIYIVTRVLF